MTSPTTPAHALDNDDNDEAAYTYIYYEKQESSLCGQHALNALLIGPYFTPGDLAEIAAELDAKERELMLAAGETEEALKFLAEDSGNVNASGFFSVEVLRLALSRFGSIELVPFNARKDGGTEGEEKEDDLTQEEGFIVNKAEHWFTLRRIGERWWNLNSTLEGGKPEEVGRFYLSAFIGQLMMDGYSVFVVTGEGLPRMGTPDGGEGGGGGLRGRGGGEWFRVSELIKGKGKKKEVVGEGTARGKGEKRNFWSTLMDAGQTLAGGGGDGGRGGMTEDEEMARAIAISLKER
ncbi:ataxin 3 variant ref [Nannochloropsis oceanica]